MAVGHVSENALLGVQIRFNPLGADDKRHCKSFMSNVREI